MNVVDSSGWLEYFADGPNAGFFAPAVENLEETVGPVNFLAGSFQEGYPTMRRERGPESPWLRCVRGVSLIWMGRSP